MTCGTGKICYPSRRDAERARQSLFQSPSAERAHELNVYRCRRCGACHVGRHASSKKRMWSARATLRMELVKHYHKVGLSRSEARRAAHRMMGELQRRGHFDEARL